MTRDTKHWFLFWITVAFILATLLICMLHVVEKVERNSNVWDKQIEQKQTQEMDSIRLNEKKLTETFQ